MLLVPVSRHSSRLSLLLSCRNREILELGLDNEDSEHENDEDTNQSKKDKCNQCHVTAWLSFKITSFFSHLGSTLQDKDEDPVPAETGQNHPFFRRSDSMTFLGCIPPNPFDVPLPEAIPLADQPHLLQVSVADQYICYCVCQEMIKICFGEN